MFQRLLPGYMLYMLISPDHAALLRQAAPVAKPLLAVRRRLRRRIVRRVARPVSS